jgi:hypothetical protein
VAASVRELGGLVTAGRHGERLRLEAGAELEAEVSPRTQARFRARLLDAVRPASKKATNGCGLWPITKQFDGGVEVVRRVDGSGCRYAGTGTCGAVHACPDCGIQERAERRDVCLALLDCVRQTMPGAAVALLTLKLRHQKGDDGRTLCTGLQRAASRMRGGAAWKREHARGMLYLANFDLTHGYANGWHPHQHVLIIHPEGVPDGWSPAQISETLGWPSWVTAVLGDAHTPSTEHGVHIEWTTDADGDHAERLAKYVGKLNLAHEITDAAGAKRARMRGHRTPWEIAEDIARLDEVLTAVEREPATPERDRRLEKMERNRWQHLETWREMVRITKGIHLHDGRRALKLGRAWLELQTKAARLRLEHAAAAAGHEPPPEVVEEERVAVIPEFDWRAIRQHRQTRIKVLEAAALQGLRGVLTVVGAMPPMELRGRVQRQHVPVVCARGRPVLNEHGDPTYTLRIWTEPPELWLPEVACVNIREATAKDWNPPELEDEIDRQSWSAADYVDT